VILAFILTVPLLPHAVAYIGTANNPNPGADFWRDIRERDATPFSQSPGTTQVKGVDSGSLINKAGEDWRLFRMDKLVPIGAWMLLGMTGIIALFYFARGRIPIEGGRSGMELERFSVAQRMVHWVVAGLFILLGVTGLILLYGRFVLIPILGPEGFGATASASKEAHNLFGPIFPFAVLAVMVYYIKGNAFRKVDLQWFLKGGGLFKKHGHANSEKYNAGQKVWFWLIVVLGLVISVSGYILDFPNFGQGRQVMALAHVSHGIVGILFIVVSLGHIYIGSIGMEGAIEAMTTGKVDANWAKEHHDLWYDEMEKAGKVHPVDPSVTEFKPAASDSAPAEQT
jgi:formate dehydrogenase subunit gamma